MGPSCLTIVVPILHGKTEELRTLLRTEIEPAPTPPGARIVGRPMMPFHRLEGLHFASILILDADDRNAARLVFETTFDGTRDAFVADLIRVAPQGLDAIFSRCAGYPATRTTIASQLADYLIAHDLGSLLMYRGTPGRTVSQIRREVDLRQTLQARASDAACVATGAAAVNPMSLGGLQSMLQADVVQRDPRVAWAEDRYADPPEVRGGLWLMAYRFLPLIAALAALWALLATGVFAPLLDFLTQSTAFSHPFVAVRDAYASLEATCVPSPLREPTTCARLAGILAYPLLPFPPLAFILMAIALAIRWLQHNRNRFYVNPFEQTRALSFSSNMLGAARYVTAALIILMFAAAVVDVPGTAVCKADPGDVIRRALAWLLRPFECRDAMRVKPWSISVAVVTVGVLALFLVLAFIRITLRIRARFLADIGSYEKRDRLKLDALRIGLLFTGGILLAGAFNHLSRPLTGNVFALVSLTAVLWLVTAVLIAGVSVAILLTLLHALLEYVERRREAGGYNAPDALMLLANQNQRAYSREDRGNNRRQNHLASLTYVKPGLWNYVSLRVILFAIDVLGRYYFNKGTLGDIPTILSARWVMLDGGRQLLFLDHYAGAWDSYLSEFVDMGAVKGVNAIWSNTFIKVRAAPDEPVAAYAFPKTSYIFWKGAQDEKPFKTYVRQSQIETLVWYGAYPDLDVVAINRATGLRKRLFETNTLDQCDGILQDL